MISQNFGSIMGLGTPELIIILVILLLLFGAKKLPELARSLGSSAHELKTSIKGGDKQPNTSATKNVDQKNTQS